VGLDLYKRRRVAKITEQQKLNTLSKIWNDLNPFFFSLFDIFSPPIPAASSSTDGPAFRQSTWIRIILISLGGAHGESQTKSYASDKFN